MTKSSMSLFGKRIVSWTMSSHDVSPSGTRKRITNGMPAAGRWGGSAEGVRPRRLAVGRAEADHERHAGGGALGDLGGREAVAAAVVLERVLAGRGELAPLLEFLAQ